MRTTLASLCSAILAVLAVGGAARADLDPGDIVLEVRNGGIVTSRVDAASGVEVLVPERVFAAEFLEGASVSEPGFDCEAFTFAVGSRTGFDPTRRLAKWNGTAFVPIDAPVVRARLGILQCFTPAVDEPTAGIGLSISAAGTFHHHFTFTLLADRGDPGAGIDPTPVSDAEAGVYLLSLRVWNTAPGISPSPEVYVVLSRGAAAGQEEAAAEWVRQNLVVSGPAPCSPADIAGSDAVPGADGAVNNGDFQLFFASFFGGCDLPGQQPCGAADIAASDGTPGADGQINNGDFQLFFTTFFSGCP